MRHFEKVFEPGFYIVGIKGGQNAVLKDPKIDGTTLEGSRVSMEQIDIDGGAIFFDLEEVVRIEQIPESKVDYMRGFHGRKLQAQELESIIQYSKLVEVAKQMKLIENKNIDERDNGEMEEQRPKFTPRVVNSSAPRANVVEIPAPGSR